MEEGVDDEGRRQRRTAGRQRLLPPLLLVCLALPTGGSPDMPANLTVDLGQRVELPCAHNQVVLFGHLYRCLRHISVYLVSCGGFLNDVNDLKVVKGTLNRKQEKRICIFSINQFQMFSRQNCPTRPLPCLF